MSDERRKALRFYLLKSFLLDLCAMANGLYLDFLCLFSFWQYFRLRFFGFCVAFYVRWKSVRMATAIVFLLAECECAAKIRCFGSTAQTQQIARRAEHESAEDEWGHGKWKIRFRFCFCIVHWFLHCGHILHADEATQRANTNLLKLSVVFIGAYTSHLSCEWMQFQ